ncbi:SMP-30/gluconolactonase/LRE family protein [Ostreiculturibacter nitratireducens]|uniref:SMP-30/gluconolactonase/LRE family protein n=1 Tax=Ostreiculturibacter nitratireducens TaxID=3075226 RepID=UPI0031B5D889
MTDPALTAPPRVFDDTRCALGEGPLWHPERAQLFWFDILNRRLLTRSAEGPKHWKFDEHVSAAGWVDADRLLVASETSLSVLNLETGEKDLAAPLERDNPATRSNDGRADPWGGFWIGTMGKRAEPALGAIYRYYRGEVRQLFAPITISNAISFPPDRRHGYFADTAARKVWRVALSETDGWPRGEPEVFIDFAARDRNPDGAVFDAEGNFWCAEWGASRVSAYDTRGEPLGHVPIPARHTSCPAFGGQDLGTLFVTTARQGLSAAMLEEQPLNGQTFEVKAGVRGQAEHRVIL